MVDGSNMDLRFNMDPLAFKSDDSNIAYFHDHAASQPEVPCAGKAFTVLMI